MSPGRASLLVAVVVSLLSACGGTSPGAGEASGPDLTAPSPTGVSAPATSTGAGPVTVDVGDEFWFAGFHVTLGTATLGNVPGESGPAVVIEAMFENQGSASAVFNGALSLASGGRFYEPSVAQPLPDYLPIVPGLATGGGAFIFPVDDSFAFEDAVLTVGSAENVQAVIPLGGTGEAVRLEPRSLQVSGDTRAGVIGADLTGGELRADVPDRHEQTEAGHHVLVLDFDVTNFKSYEGGFAFAFGNNLALELPDGTTIAADDGPIELLKLGTTLPDQHVRFTVPDPVEGTYALVLIDDTKDRRGKVAFETGP